MLELTTETKTIRGSHSPDRY